MSEANLNDIIYIEEQWHSLFKQLTETNDVSAAPFRTMKDMFMWSASIGFERGTRKQITGKKVGIFRWAQFSPQVDVPLLKALAIADTGDVAVLQDLEKVLVVVQEYANAGICELQQTLLEEYGQPLQNLIKLLS
jgi:dnd system-associated protein 4